MQSLKIIFDFSIIIMSTIYDTHLKVMIKHTKCHVSSSSSFGKVRVHTVVYSIDVLETFRQLVFELSNI